MADATVESRIENIENLLNQLVQQPQEKKLLIAGEEEGSEPTEYAFADMDDQLQVLYTKLEIVQKQGQQMQTDAQFKIEQNQILQNAYSQAIKAELAKSNESEAEVVDESDGDESEG